MSERPAPDPDPAQLEQWRDAARQWIAMDPDPETATALSATLAAAGSSAAAAGELGDLVGNRLAFGTAGLRGRRGPGPHRLNRLVARQTAAGLADVIVARSSAGTEDAAEDGARPVLIGFDARWKSDVFAADVAEVLAAAGLAVILAPDPQPTPFLSWTMRQIDAVAAVVVTASHNPPADSGIKIYWEDGAQIIPPVDEWIAAAIDTHAGSNPRGAPDAVDRLDPQWWSRYVGFAASMGPASPPDVPLRVATTALHGVGAATLAAALATAGFDDVIEVAEQRDPDPDFPTVTFPNPEEAGATDLLMALAERRNADIALALDPDADRLAMGCVRAGHWSLLTGDELGALFCEGLLTARDRPTGAALVVSTVVSSRLAGRIAVARGARFEETLTGFKWLCRPGLADPDAFVVLAYEEALGYALSGLRDKDGISAAVAAAALCRRWKSDGRRPTDVLDALAVEFGAHVQMNTSIRREGDSGPAETQALGRRFAESPPDRLGGSAVTRSDRPAPDVIRLYVGADDRVVVRPSGTEPKLKFYCEAVEPVVGTEPADAARDRARRRLERIAASLDEFTSGPP